MTFIEIIFYRKNLILSNDSFCNELSTHIFTNWKKKFFNESKIY